MALSAPATPRASDVLAIDGRSYRFSAHPAAPGVAFGQEGRSAVVYQIMADDGAPHPHVQALKIFRQQFRVPRLADGARRLRAFAALPGLAVCQRNVLTPDKDAGLVRTQPELEYAVVMPWAEGRTWHDVLLSREPLSADDSHALATTLADVLASLEAHGLAHCDLSGPNVVLDIASRSVSLVDVEDLYGPGMPRPEQLPAGSDGYAHRTAPAGMWGADADRFAAAVLLAEMLGWSDERVRRHAVGERYFARDELQLDCERHQVLRTSLEEHWGAPLADAFERAWHSSSLTDCPTLREWQSLIARQPSAGTAGPEPEDISALAERFRRRPELKSADAYARALLARASVREERGDHHAALVDYREASNVAPAGALKDELTLVVRDLIDKGDQLAPSRCPNANCGRPVQAGWIRCPACDQVLDEHKAPPAPPPAVDRDRRVRLAVGIGGVVAIVALVAIGVASLVWQRQNFEPSPQGIPWQAVGDARPVHFAEPVGFVADAQGNRYVSQNGLHSITVLAPDGQVIGRWGHLGYLPGEVRNPAGLAMDANGTLYVADRGNSRIVKFAADGTPAGQIGGKGSERGQLNSPRGVAVDEQGNILVADTENHRVQKFSADGTPMGVWGSFGNGPEHFNFPYAIASDARANIYVADRNNNRIVVLGPDGRPSGAWPTTGNGADLINPAGIAVDRSGNVYVGGWQDNRTQLLQKRSPDGQVQATWTMPANSPAQQALSIGLGVDPNGGLYMTQIGDDQLRRLSETGETLETFGEPRSAPGQFRRPNNVAVDGRDNTYAVDWANQRVSVFAPNGQLQGHFGPFRDLQGIAADRDGNMYVTERSDCRVRKIAPNGQTLALWGSCGNGSGQLMGPEGLAVDGDGSVLVADRGNQRVVRFAPWGEMVSVWGTQGEFDDPSGVAVDRDGNIFVADRDHNRVVKLSRDGEIAALWDHLKLVAPEAVATDSQGKVFVADWGESRVLMLSSTGELIQEHGGAGPRAGQFDAPEGVAVDSKGAVYVADTGNNRVQRRAP